MLSTTAMAADETISGFYDIGTATDVVITPYAGVETLAPTCAEDGVMTYTCSVCGETKTEAIEKLPSTSHTPGNVNGDAAVDIKDVIAIRQHIAGGYDVELQ